MLLSIYLMEQPKRIALLEWIAEHAGAGAQLAKLVLPSAALVYEALAAAESSAEMTQVAAR